MEIVLQGNGEVDKVTIVRPSGVLTFDVAAIDTVYTAGPYGDTPEQIRSADGKVYLHWTFHRNEFQCSNQFADPFILDNPPKGNDKRGLPTPEGRGKPTQLTRKKGSATEGGVEVPRVVRESTSEDRADAARANANLPTPDDPAAEDAALAWLNAFEKGDVQGMIAVSDTPFRSAGKVVASDLAGVGGVWQNVLTEAPKKRRVSQWKLFSAAGYRAVFGHLPPGGEDGTPTLFLVVKVGAETYTLDVVSKDRGYRVVGFNL
jgi:hypothetical protein